MNIDCIPVGHNVMINITCSDLIGASYRNDYTHMQATPAGHEYQKRLSIQNSRAAARSTLASSILHFGSTNVAAQIFFYTLE